MRFIIIVAAFVAAVSPAFAQEPSPLEQAQALQQMLQRSEAERFQLIVEINRLRSQRESAKEQAPSKK